MEDVLLDPSFMIGATFCCSIVLVMLILVLNDRQKRNLVVAARKRGVAPPREYLNYQTNWFNVWFVIVVAPVLFALIMFKAEIFRALPPLGQSIAMWVGGLSKTGGGLAVLAVLIIITQFIPAFIFLRWRLRREKQKYVAVEMLALEGHVAEAHDELVRLLFRNRDDVDTTKNTVILNYLASLQVMKGNWDSAIAYIERLKLESSLQLSFLAHEALALWMCGRMDEAVSCLERRGSNDEIARMTAGLFFAKTGAVDDAGEILDWIGRAMTGRMDAQLRLILGTVQDSIRRLVENAKSRNPIDDQAATDLFNKAIRAILVCHCHISIGVLRLEQRHKRNGSVAL